MCLQTQGHGRTIRGGDALAGHGARAPTTGSAVRCSATAIALEVKSVLGRGRIEQWSSATRSAMPRDFDVIFCVNAISASMSKTERRVLTFASVSKTQALVEGILWKNSVEIASSFDSKILHGKNSGRLAKISMQRIVFS